METDRWHRLVLHPRAPEQAPSTNALAAALAGVGLLGAELVYRGERYYCAGERFLDLVVFLGCSPVIELAPQTDAAGEPLMAGFCHVHLPPACPAPRLWRGDPRVRPRCPHCREGIADPLPVPALAPGSAELLCPACGRASAVAALDWRRSAAIACRFVEIGGIYPQEAIPAEGLLTALEAVGAGPWDYFYAGGPAPGEA